MKTRLHITTTTVTPGARAARTALWVLCCIAPGSWLGGQGPEAVNDLPAFVIDALAREGELAGEGKIEALGGSVRATVPTELIALEALDGYDYLQLASGGNFPIECYLYRNPIDVAQLLAKGSQSMLTQYTEQFGGERSREIRRVEAAVAGSVPYLFAEWWFMTGAEQVKLGSVKLVAAASQDVSMLCSHGDLGYRATFRTVVEGLLDSFERTDGSTAAPLFREVSLVSIQGLDVGYVIQTLDVDEEGDWNAVLTNVLVTPTDSRTLQATDSTTIEWTNARGELINRTEIETDSGQLTQMLDGFETETGDWAVAGTLEGEQFEKTFAKQGPFLGLLGEIQALRQLRASAEAGSTVALPTWTPDVDPGGPAANVLTLRDDGRVDMSTGDLASVLTVDAHGNVTRMEATDVDVVFRRVLSTGQEAFDAALARAIALQDAASANSGQPQEESGPAPESDPPPGG